MAEFEVRWEGALPASPREVRDAFTVHTAGWLWTIEYEPRAGGAERGLTPGGGTVTVWDPPRRFVTRAEGEDGGDVAPGDRVRLSGPAPVEGVVDYATPHFLGVRSGDALYRFYGRDAWGMPVGVAHRLFGGGAGEEGSMWLNEVFAAEAVK